MQVAILLSRFAATATGPAQQDIVSLASHSTSDVSRMGDVQDSYVSVQQRLDSIVKALAANGVNV